MRDLHLRNLPIPNSKMDGTGLSGRQFGMAVGEGQCSVAIHVLDRSRVQESVTGITILKGLLWKMMWMRP